MSQPLAKREFTASQVVAYNFTQARKLRGWSQDETADRLASFVGARWGKANISALERSARTGNRRIDVDDLLAFARAFELPLVWFFMPPQNAAALVGAEPARKRGVPSARPVEQRAMAPAELMARVFGGFPLDGTRDEMSEQEAGWLDLAERIQDLPEEFHAFAMRLNQTMVDLYTKWAIGYEAGIERQLRELADRFSDANIEVAKRLVSAIGFPDQSDERASAQKEG